MSMIRIEVLEERDGGFHTVGLHKLVPDSYFSLIDLDTIPRLVNAYPLHFDGYAGGPKTLTHLGIFPDIEYTGMVTELTAPLPIKEGEYVSFKAKAITMTMVVDAHTGITVAKR